MKSCYVPIYIISANQISIQQPLCDTWLDSPIHYDNGFHESIDPQFKQWLSPGEARRLGKIMKRAVATSAVTMQESGIDSPDAIITATGLGCVKNTELFLTDLCTNGEQLLKPTQFMQSTHNTIGSLIAIINKNHGYNVTYANGDVSTETAILDAVTQLSIGEIRSALIGAHDEMTQCYYTLLERIGYYGTENMVTSGETAVSFMLSVDRTNKPLCVLDEISVMHKPTDVRIGQFIKQLGNIDCVLAGFNGNTQIDAKYNALIQRHFSNSTILQYKNIFGESMTASALGIYAAATILANNRLPVDMVVSGDRSINPRNILCLNMSHDNVALVKLSTPAIEI